MPQLKLYSWNVNGIRACAKKGLFDYLGREKADVVCIQEIKARPEDCEEISESLQKFEAHWHPAERPGYSGVLTLTQKKPHVVRVGCGISEFDQEGRVLVTDHGEFLLLNMYFPNGGSGEERHLFKMKFLSKILPFFKKLEKEKPLVLSGDFNIAHKEIDIHYPVRLDGESGFKPEERNWMDELVSAGFVDLFREKYPSAKDSYTWWSYRQGSRRRNKGWRIDYFFASPRIVPSVKSIRHDVNVEGSDHCPLVLELR